MLFLLLCGLMEIFCDGKIPSWRLIILQVSGEIWEWRNVADWGRDFSIFWSFLLDLIPLWLLIIQFMVFFLFLNKLLSPLHDISPTPRASYCCFFCTTTHTQLLLPCESTNFICIYWWRRITQKKKRQMNSICDVFIILIIISIHLFVAQSQIQFTSTSACSFPMNIFVLIFILHLLGVWKGK